jgi:cation diffusion facilitator family transporter
MVEKKSEKPIVVIGAIIANVVIAAIKYIAAIISGSSAMLSEAIHSTADTGNELLLLFGRHQSQKPPDPAHPFGHGREIYFWGLIVAIMLFSIGAGMSVYEGLSRLNHPEPPKDPTWNYVVLGFAFLAESASWLIAYRHMLAEKRPDESFWHSVTSSKDPASYIVLGEDSAAIAGLIVAFLGVFLGHLSHSYLPDAIAALLIGVILAIVAFFLAYQSKSLLIGETADLQIVNSVKSMVENDPQVIKVQRILSSQLGPEEVFLALDVQFKPELPASSLVEVIDRLEQSIRQEHKTVGKIFIEAEDLDPYGREAY